MTSNDSSDGPGTKRCPSSPPSDEQMPSELRFTASRPLGVAGEPSLAKVIHAMATCAHPDEAATTAAVVEPDESRMTIAWCGACGALRLPGDKEDEWIRPGLGLALEADDRLEALRGVVRALIARLEQVSRAAHRLCEVERDEARPLDERLSAAVVSLDGAGAEIVRCASIALGELSR